MSDERAFIELLKQVRPEDRDEVLRGLRGIASSVSDTKTDTEGCALPDSVSA